jgi:peptide/nickel transport system substrate-binding protein
MDWVGHSDSATIIQEQLSSLGIRVKLTIQPIPLIAEKRQTGDYLMLIDGQKPTSPDPDFYTNWFHSSLGGQYAVGTGFSLPELDRLLEEGRTVSDPAEREAIYRAVETLLLDEAPWIFLQYRPDGEATANSVKGYVGLPGVLALYNQAYLENVWLSK